MMNVLHEEGWRQIEIGRKMSRSLTAVCNDILKQKVMLRTPYLEVCAK